METAVFIHFVDKILYFRAPVSEPLGSIKLRVIRTMKGMGGVWLELTISQSDAPLVPSCDDSCWP